MAIIPNPTVEMQIIGQRCQPENANELRKYFIVFAFGVPLKVSAVTTEDLVKISPFATTVNI
jgi:hypothetical protein